MSLNCQQSHVMYLVGHFEKSPESQKKIFFTTKHSQHYHDQIYKLMLLISPINLSLCPAMKPVLTKLEPTSRRLERNRGWMCLPRAKPKIEKFSTLNTTRNPTQQQRDRTTIKDDDEQKKPGKQRESDPDSPWTRAVSGK